MKGMKHIIIITGASSGMGVEFSRQLAKEYNSTSDTEFWLIARTKEKLETVADSIKAEGISVRIFPIDLKGQDGVSKLETLLNVEKEVGTFSIDVLVNNAGFGTYGPFEQTDLKREMDMVDLNCTALTGICGLALPHMHKGGRIINVASLASFLPLGNFAVYGASKAFVLSFTMALRAEVKDRGIKVCALCPGPVSTNFANIASNGARKEVLHGLDAADVVKHCLSASKAGKAAAIMAFKWKFKAFMSRFVGRYAGARFTYLFCKRPSQ